MDGLMSIIGWVKGNMNELVNAVVYAIALASIVVKFTPTPKDDAILGKIKKFLSKYIALNPDSKN